MTERKKTLKENILEFISMDNIKNQVMINAYGNTDTPIARLDPRVLMIWYLFFAISPWFINNNIILMAMFSLVLVTSYLAKIAKLVVLVFAIGVFSQTGWLLIISLFFGADSSVIYPLLILTLKVSTVSLASITVFSGMDPDNLSKGLMYFGFSERLSFSISYAYRILPNLIEEFQNIYLSYKLRSLAPNKDGIRGKFSYFVYEVKILLKCFYPLILNTAKKSRTTVEALEIRGYSYAAISKKAKEIRLSSLKVTSDDLIFLLISFIWLSIGFLIATII